MSVLHQVRVRGNSIKWIFTTSKGQPLWTKRVYEQFAKVRTNTPSVPIEHPEGGKRTIHSARHTFASLAIQDGQDIQWVSNQLGHNSPAYTLRAYSHCLPAKRDLGFAEFTARESS